MSRPRPSVRGRRPRRWGKAIPLCGIGVLLAAAGGCRPAEKKSETENRYGTREQKYAEGKAEEQRSRALENARREKERLDIRAQADTLARSLARRTAAQDRIRFRVDPVPEPEEVAVGAFDSRWGWVILRAGAESGVRVGQVYNIFRSDLWVARIRVTDVRERISGAWVEEIRSGWTPDPGDRAVREQREQRER